MDELRSLFFGATDPRVVRALNAASGAGIALFGVYGLACVFRRSAHAYALTGSMES